MRKSTKMVIGAGTIAASVIGFMSAGWIAKISLSFLSPDRESGAFSDYNAMALLHVRWGLTFASIFVLPFILFHIQGENEGDSSRQKRALSGVACASAVVFLSIIVAIVRSRNLPFEHLQDSRWIYFLLAGSGFQSAFYVLAFTSLLMFWFFGNRRLSASIQPEAP